MKKIIFVFLFVILLSGCSQNTTNNSVNKQNDEELSKKELFEMKQKCESYKNNIEKNINQHNSSLGLEKIDNLIYKDFKEIFYSPKLNSCLYLETDTNFFKGIDPDPNGGYPENSAVFNNEKFYINDQSYLLIDTLTGVEIDNVITEWRNTPRELMSNLETASTTDIYPAIVEEMLKQYTY